MLEVFGILVQFHCLRLHRETGGFQLTYWRRFLGDPFCSAHPSTFPNLTQWKNWKRQPRHDVHKQAAFVRPRNKPSVFKSLNEGGFHTPNPSPTPRRKTNHQSQKIFTRFYYLFLIQLDISCFSYTLRGKPFKLFKIAIWKCIYHEKIQ